MKLKKKNLTKILLFLTLVSLTTQNCALGCLKCNSDKKCIICDTTNNFTLIAQKCEKADQPNCLQINQKGQCLSCAPENYIDENTLKCIQVEDSAKIENCLYYSNGQTCQSCQEGFFLTLKCEQVIDEIEGCSMYKDAAHCSICAEGRFLSYSGTKCDVLESLANCSGYSSIRCNECEQGSILNFNSYVYSLTSMQNLGDVTLLPLLMNFDVGLGYFKNMCKPIDVLNCENYVSFEECKICVFGYYLDKGKCLQYPSEIIPQCEEYDSFTSCYKCKEGFHINPSKKCDQNEKIESCLEYDPKATQTVCTICEDDFFLLSDTNCKIRSVTEIVNCDKLSKTEEKCESCQDGYTQTDDGQACLPELLKCTDYESSTKSTTTLICKTCENNFYKNSEGVCVSGKVLNCEIYNNDQTCQKCKNKYFLENSICSSHSEILSCDQYNLTEKDKCFQCNFESLNFSVENICKETENIEGCDVYSSATSCFSCKEGYYLNVITCVKINEALNCLVYDLDTSKCVKCKKNFVFFGGVCVLVMNVVSENCGKVDLDNGVTVLQNAKCEFCAENAVFYDIEEYVCVEKEWLALLVTTVVDHCAKYFEDNGTECKKCEFGYFLKTSTECVESCPEGMLISSFEAKTNPFVGFVETSFECIDYDSLPVDKCKIAMSPIVDTDSGSFPPACIKCVNDFKVIDFTGHYTLPINEYNPLINNGLPTNPVSFFPNLTNCSDFPNADVFPGQGPIENCDYYYNYNNNLIGCIKCKHGFTGTLQKNDAGETYITSCQNSKCGKTFIPGLPQKLNSYISCHTCTGDKLPVLFGKLGITSSQVTIQGLSTYALDSMTTDWDTGSSGNSMECHSVSDLSSLTTISPLTMPENCAILFMDVTNSSKNADSANKITGIDTDELAVFCLACERGYKRSVFVISMVGRCEAIAHCATSAWFNYCSECKMGYSHGMDGDAIDYEVCVESNDVNCFAGSANDCAYCRKGYMFNYDGVCEVIMMPKCVLSGFEVDFKKVVIPLVAYLAHGKGCVQCEEGYVALSKQNQTFNEKICVPSEYAKNQTFKDGLDNFITNCKNYYLEGVKLLCKYCLEGSVVSQNGATCYPIDSLLFCELATNSTSCSQCIKTHISVSGVCKKKEIKNCKEYVKDSALTSQKCQLCDPSYYINESICEKANVNNCEVFATNPNICTQCFTGFEKVTDSEGNTYCFPHDTALNCAIFDSTKFEQQIIKCTKCKSDSNYYISTSADDFKNSICSKFTEVPNCKLKRVGNSFTTSTFMCKECEDGYYSKNGNCTLRSNLHSKCEIYFNSMDLCQKCQSENFLSESKKECHPFPNGIIGCRVYTSSTKCVGCLENYYLSGDNCLKITEENQIQDCIFYSDTTICKQCKDNFILQSNTCFQVKALNCKTSLSPNTCGSCFSDRGLKEEGEKTNCVKPEDPKCSLFTPKYPFECQQCEKGYYVGVDKICVPVETSVDNCEAYKSKDLCKRCRKGYVLSKNFDLCMSYSYLPVDPRCEDTEEGAVGCVVCEAGFFMSEEGQCQACQASECYFCDPLDSGVCLVCKPGSFMGEDFKCNLIVEEVVEVEVEFWKKFGAFLGIFVVLFV